MIASRACLLAIALFASACSRTEPAGAAASASSPAPAAPASVAAVWAELPRSPEAASALIDARTLREVSPDANAPIASASLLAIATARGLGGQITGSDRIVRWIQAFLDAATRENRDAVVLIGGYHDAAGQVDAFRQLIGPSGLKALDRVGVEQFRADGAWQGVPSESQRGDGSAIAAYVERGDLGAFETLVARHHESDYAAWKFGYEARVMELLVSARATRTALRGCDMPSATQALLATVGDDARLRLRELHCLLSLPPARSPHRSVLFWGQAHVRPGGLRRFLPQRTAALSIHLVGFRGGEGSHEATLAKRLALVDPVLIPLDASSSEVALLYPEGPLGAQVDRVRASELGGQGLTVRATRRGLLQIGARRVPVGPEPTEVAVREGEGTYAIDIEGVVFVGALRIPIGGALELDIDAEQRSVRAIERPAR